MDLILKYYKYILYPLLIVCVLSFIVWIVGLFKGCGKDYVPVTPDSVLNRKFDSIMTIINSDIRRNNQKYDSTINNANLERKFNQRDFNFYMNEFIKSNNRKKTLPLQEQWNEYLKELENE